MPSITAKCQQPNSPQLNRNESTFSPVLCQNDAELHERYWSKLIQIRASYGEKLYLLSRELSRILTMDWEPERRAQLSAIHRKMAIMQQVLNSTPENNRFGTNLEVIHSVELQVMFWLNQLQSFQQASTQPMSL